MTELAFEERAPASGGPARQLVIMVHGYGADGRDLIDLADIFGRYLPDAHFVAPHAPDPCEIAPFGRQWFSLSEGSMQQRWLGVTTVAPVLDQFIDAQQQLLGLSADRVALLGFSQGAMLSLHVGPRRDQAMAGILSYSGMLIEADHLSHDMQSKPPVLLIHGKVDEVVTVDGSRKAFGWLQAEGFDVSLKEISGLGHGISPDGIEAGAEFLVECFNTKP